MDTQYDGLPPPGKRHLPTNPSDVLVQVQKDAEGARAHWMFFTGCELSLPTGKIICCLAVPLKAFIGTDVKTGQERLFVEATDDSPR